jgi:MoaA/NifB/PqqE/SkfB family radical SAM enzyme
MLPLNLTLTPSPRCNSRCRTCNIWKKREDELTLDEWARTLQSIGTAPFWFTVSGGEPFLYEDLVDLCELAYTHCQPGIINIPTNGILSRIPEKVESICRRCPDAEVIINLSLDGVDEKHDQIRRVPGNFEKFERSYAALRALDCPNLTVGIHSVISRFNVADVLDLYDYALGLEPDAYITEIAEERVELDTLDNDITPSADQYAEAIDPLIEALKSRRFQGISTITEGFRIEYYKLVKRVLVEKTQVIPCYAGWASAQIYANGEVWPCCVRADVMGNVRDVNYDFKEIWFSQDADRVRTSIFNKECHCPLANASYTNMLMHVPTLMRVSGRIALSGAKAFLDRANSGRDRLDSNRNSVAPR